jgi:hypothetical protein
MSIRYYILCYVLIICSCVFAQTNKFTHKAIEDSLANIVANEIATGSYFESKAYINAEYNFFVRFPKSWDYKENFNNNLVFGYRNFQSSDSVSTCALSVEKVPLNTTIDSFTVDILSLLKSSFHVQQEPIVRKVILGNNEYRKIIIKMQEEAQNGVLITYLRIKNEYCYEITFSTFEKHLDLFTSDFDKIMRYFKIL